MKKLLLAFLFIPSIAIAQADDVDKLLENAVKLQQKINQAQKANPAPKLRMSPEINFELLGVKPTSSEKNEDLKRFQEGQINGNLQPLSPKAPPKRVWDFNEQTKDVIEKKAFGVGTGTRGGGSGVATLQGERLEVLVLDIYRSFNREQSPMFQAVDDEFLAFDKSADPEIESDRLLAAILSRFDKSVPSLAQAIRKAQTEMPFKSWVPSDVELPLIDDYIGKLSLNENQKHVQIAYRRANKIIYVRSLYDAMDALNRAALKLHEFVYAVSGNEQSAQIQRFVSLAMSEKSRSATFAKEAIGLLAQLTLDNLARPSMQLPKTAKLGYARLSSDDVCGRIQSIDVNPADKSAVLTILYDPDRPQLIRKDLDGFRKSNPVRAYQLIGALRKPARVHLDTAQLLEVFGALYAAKGQLQIKYPIYLYPGQSWPADLVCLNEGRNKVVQLEGALEIHRQIRDNDLELARLEAEYFRLNAELKTSSSKIHEYYQVESDLALLGFKQRLLTSTPFVLLWPESETLENIVVRFE